MSCGQVETRLSGSSTTCLVVGGNQYVKRYLRVDSLLFCLWRDFVADWTDRFVLELISLNIIGLLYILPLNLMIISQLTYAY